MISEHEILNVFAQNVLFFRHRLKISQEELAFRAGVHRTYVGMIERAEKNITLVNIEKFAKALDVSISDLVEKVTEREL